jgi:hypothetical protein
MFHGTGHSPGWFSSWNVHGEGVYIARSYEKDCHHTVRFVLCECGIRPTELPGAGVRQEPTRRGAVELCQEMLRYSGSRKKPARRGAHQLHQEVHVGCTQRLSRFYSLRPIRIEPLIGPWCSMRKWAFLVCIARLLKKRRDAKSLGTLPRLELSRRPQRTTTDIRATVAGEPLYRRFHVGASCQAADG